MDAKKNITDRNDKQKQSGQAVVEYIVMLAVVTFFFVIVSRWLTDMDLGTRLNKPIQEDYARAYQYGRVDAKGMEDGGPLNHARYTQPAGNNFRIFINPHKP